MATKIMVNPSLTVAKVQKVTSSPNGITNVSNPSQPTKATNPVVYTGQNTASANPGALINMSAPVRLSPPPSIQTSGPLQLSTPRPPPLPQAPSPVMSQTSPAPPQGFAPPPYTPDSGSAGAAPAWNYNPAPPVADDSQQWNDPAPAAVASTVSDSSNPGIATSTALATVAPSTPGLWTRFLTWLGIIKPVTAATTIHGESTLTVEQAAASLVRRVRNGDQNAMSLMVMIRENAMNGNATAQKTYQLMRQYIDKNPESKGATYAGEKSNVNHGWAKAVYLANGPLLMDHKVADVAASFGAEEAKHFISGVMLPTHPAVSDAHHHGKVVGMARKIQAVRMPNSRISDYSATVGWELGE